MECWFACLVSLSRLADHSREDMSVMQSRATYDSKGFGTPVEIIISAKY